MPNPVLERVPALRRLTDRPFPQACVRIGRLARLVAKPTRFAAGELQGSTETHRLRGSDRRVVLRHRTRDIAIFAEIFGRDRIYEPPAQAAAALTDTAPLRVLDLGANIGLFAVDALERYRRAVVTSYEPDPGNLPTLRACAKANRSDPWVVVEKCALAENRAVRISSDLADSRVGDEGSLVEGVDILPVLAEHDFVKMDIEGSEWPILNDPRWPAATAHVRVLVLEYHKVDEADPRPLASAAIERAGFTTFVVGGGPTSGLIWGWR